MKMFEVLKAAKTGRCLDSYEYLFSRNFTHTYRVKSAGGSTIHLPDVKKTPATSYTIYGKSWQDNEPSPDNPAEIHSIGEAGKYEEVVGNNLFTRNNPSLDNAYLYPDGMAGSLMGYMISGNIYVSPNTKYMLKLKDFVGNAASLCVYNSINSVVYGFEYNGKTEFVFTTSSDAYYVRLTWHKSYPDPWFGKCKTVYPVDVVTSNNKGESTTTRITLDEPLRGIPVSDASLATYTDENGQMWCADELRNDGTLIRRIKSNITDLTENQILDSPASSSVATYALPLFVPDSTITNSDNAYMDIVYKTNEAEPVLFDKDGNMVIDKDGNYIVLRR